MNKNQEKNTALLSLKEFCSYVNIGETKAREILNDPRCDFCFRIGNRLYANKKKLDQRLSCYETLI